MPWFLTSHEKKALLFTAALVLCGAAVMVVRQRSRERGPVPADARSQVRQRIEETDRKYDRRPVRPVLDLNEADEQDLLRLPTVGHATACRIVQYRRLNGPFKDVAELVRVPGVGEKRFREIAPYVFVPEQADVPHAARPPGSTAPTPSD